MKYKPRVSPETEAAMKKMTPEDRKKFLAYLGDADANISSASNYLDAEKIEKEDPTESFLREQGVDPDDFE